VRIVHLSDLHFGHHDRHLAAGLTDEITGQSPDLVVVSGDFTQIGSTAEFAMAADFLRTLAAPLFAVPGNHDVPARNLLRRFINPYGLYRRYIADEIEPVLELDGVVLVGINTARRLRLGLNWAEGSINRGQLRRAREKFEAAHSNSIRIVVAHHPLLQPNVAASMHTVKRADSALATFQKLGVRMVLSGHFHLSYVRRHSPAEITADVPSGPRRAACGEVIVVQAASTISTRLREQPNSYNVIDIGSEVSSFFVREWTNASWRTREQDKVRF
jgi:3',5'-cyclic AMP phosphodiesterase CpdA